MERMSTLTDQFSEFTTRTQDAVRSWADTVQSVTTGQAKLPDAHVVVDRYFDFAQQVLDGQRAVVSTVLDAGTKAAETVTDTVTSKAAGATKAATRKTSGTGTTES